MSVKQKIQKWVDENPDGYLKKSFKEIADEADVSYTSVQNHLLTIIADRDGILPSEIIQKRKDAGLKQSPRALELSKAEIADIDKYDAEGMDPRDIAYIVGVSLFSVRKHLNKKG